MICTDYYLHNRIWLETYDIRRINMTQETAKLRKPSNAYNIFILVLTVLSLAVMVVMLLPLSDATHQVAFSL